MSFRDKSRLCLTVQTCGREREHGDRDGETGKTMAVGKQGRGDGKKELE